MGEARLGSATRRQPRHWSFASCHFDEANWSLTVGSRRVSVEAKPLEILRELLVRAGEVVTKDELLERIWPDVTVVEASLPTAMYKLRQALGDNKRERAIIETIPGIGYRLAVPVEVAEPAARLDGHDAPISLQAVSPAGAVNAAAGSIDETQAPKGRLKLVAAGAVLAIASWAVGFSLAPSQQSASAEESPPISQQEAVNALRRLDVARIEEMLAAGWNPSTLFDSEGTDSLSYVLNICEWNPNHDRQRMLLMARTLIDGGARIDRRNIWGDTAYSIAKADRYCGPDHPVTRMIQRLCYSGFMPPGDRCLASYEIARRRGGNSIGGAP